MRVCRRLPAATCCRVLLVMEPGGGESIELEALGGAAGWFDEYENGMK